MRALELAVIAAALTPATAAADTSISLRTGYFLDDTASELSDRFIGDGKTPQASLVGLGIVQSLPENFLGGDWSFSAGGLWGRGNEHLKDVSVIRQDDELVLSRDMNQSLRLFFGYRYEYTGVRTQLDGHTVTAADGLPAGATGGALERTTSGQIRHSLRVGFTDDAIVAENEGNSRLHAIASLSAVAALGNEFVDYQVDTDPGAGSHLETFTVEQHNIWRAGPEITAGLRWNLGDRDFGGASVELKYRGTFLLDRFATNTQVTAIHGISLSLGYRF